jgi:MYXO-CTERM domain-containing protein
VCEASKTLSASCNATTDCASPPCRECASGFCADGYCCDRACDGACEECALDPGTCHFMKKGAEGAPSCAPYACTGASGACDATCTTKDDCAPDGWCDGGKCFANRGIGEACAIDDACNSGHCADGVCCDSKCSGQCEACNLVGSKGKCTAVVGQPQAPRAACGGGSADAPCTQLGCDGVVRTTCAGYAGKDTICAKAKCEAGAESPEGRCDGKGACAATPAPCDPYVCGPTACKTSCATDADCVKGFLCDAGRCKSTSRCDGAHTLANLDGSTTDCSPYACSEDGVCRKSCRSTSECAEGFQCDEHGACLPSTPAENASGCGCRLASEERSGGAWLACALFALAWRRRRSTSSRASRSEVRT